MKKTVLLLFAFLLHTAIQANPVSIHEARTAAGNFLHIHERNITFNQLNLRDTFRDTQGNELIYVFDIDNQGYILMSADDAMPAVVGYSMEGNFNRTQLPPHLLSWLDGYCEDMTAVMQIGAPNEAMRSQQKEWHNEWQALQANDDNYYSRKAGKNVEALLTSRWNQGAGYNNYCPMYGNHHAVTGCVATAMAQIIRYHAYPNVGYGSKSYVHQVYGLQSATFDTSYYDYSMMPDHVSYYSDEAEQHAVSLLCYHCGVAVNMNYESTLHTSGSGAYSNDVPEALYHFGYTNSFHLNKNGIPEEAWDSLLYSNLDQGLPVYYSGQSSSGGHAFVCDGYRSTSNKYHFNFGWGGSGDGFYSLSSVNGYSTAQAAVFNIVPSDFGPMQDTIYVAADGFGDGSSWANANPNLESAIALKGLYKTGVILVKGGTYYGDTNGNGAAFNLAAGIKIFGGFDGTEQSIADRRVDAAPTILSGQGRRRVMNSTTLPKTTTLNNLHFTDGFADQAAALYTANQVIIQSCDFYNNTTTHGDNMHLTNSLFVGGKVYNNHCGGAAINTIDGNIKNVLIAHNDGNGIGGSGSFLNCDIVCNSNAGVVGNQLKLRNSVVWHNGTNLDSENSNPSIVFCAIEGYDVSADTNSNINLAPTNRPMSRLGPFFVDPDTTMGISATLGDWHLSSLSPLRDAGDTLQTSVPNADLDGDNRCEYGRVDIGCYEYGYESITPNNDAAIRLYPNPATDVVMIEGLHGDFTIYDMMGRSMLQGAANGAMQINVGFLPRGIYLLRHEHGMIKMLINR